ncbi:zinc finger domain-containing protein [Streptomyces sp. SP18CS02]|uniref:zinc finger domain-containing protein n=1 Tax=Streptomyces sp. SP18CS02 TaxID=3002531 RepID=UPI002E785FE3|nr:hypothetical protein [Streptomyces sp. SP18CS02]MEE1751402.1 hypothetical protein [Streptomyces sp. SP18CS02]
MSTPTAVRITGPIPASVPSRKPEGTGGAILDATLDGIYETLRLYRHGAFSVPCPSCHVPAGELCRARRSVHNERRRAHRAHLEGTTLVPLLAAPVR